MSSAQKVPAWKRLGLKLKQPASGAEIGGPAPAEGSKPNGQRLHDRHASGPVANAANASPAAAAAAKRKRLDQQAPPASSSPFKRTRTDDSSGHATPTLRKQKSVTFADDVKNPTAAADEPKRKSKGPKKAAKTATQQPTADIKPSLEYLRNWKSSRDTWKFNKNHQTILMKRVFHADAIPSSDIATFYDYIQDLKGFTRTRLKETAAEVKKEDAEKGKAAFPEGTPDMDSKQSEYEKVLAGLMQLGSGSKRKRFDEPGFVSQSTDVAVTQRVIKRMRAETILEELSDNDDSDAMTVDAEEAAPAAQEAETVDKRIKLNDGTKQPTARRRKRRTNVDSSSESSDSESESDSDSDSGSGSGSGSDSDDSDNASEIQRQAAQREAETTSESSSSSSSSEDEDSGSEDDSEEEEETTKKKGSKK
ncbi:hypothetical protein LX32DRAFT_638066 [Colletotrichum zoysiae]|uniref:WKF domain-containing protein n=1 Tax=Colletotrichum zoysiae TaxID=1216348 RepID=A0AAD9HJZ8_9PEZI|nr:hypothetical protein LX32DRAFT_638066 [Colletotrichum zoysiae]